MDNQFLIKYGKEKFDLSPHETLVHRKSIEDSFGYNMAVIENDMKESAKYLLKVFMIKHY